MKKFTVKDIMTQRNGGGLQMNPYETAFRNMGDYGMFGFWATVISKLVWMREKLQNIKEDSK